MPWRELEHPADLRLEIEGETLEALAKECVYAFYSVASGEIEERPGDEIPGNIEVFSSEGDLEGLLVALMNELLFRLETTRQVFLPESVEFDISKMCLLSRGKWMPATCPGSRVKAVTYGGLELDPGPPWRFKVIMDV